MSDIFISREKAGNDLLACAAFIAERIKSSNGHAEAMGVIIPLYLALGNIDLAAELANAVEDPFSRDKLLIVVAEKCAELDDDEYALQLADTVEDDGLRAQVFERVALVKAGKGQAEKAAEIASSMAHPDFVFAGIAINQAASDNDAGAEATLERIEFSTARVSALQQMAASQIENSEVERAVSSLDRARSAADEIEHDEEKIRVLCDIGNLFIEAKRNDRAIETFDHARNFAEVLDNIHRDFFLVSCALGFLYAGSPDLADGTLDLVADKTQMASALLAFARDYWKKEETTDAVDTLEEAYAIVNSQREAETRDSRARNSLLASIAAQFAGFGKTDRAVEIALENQDPNEQTTALSQIAQILTVQKEDSLARQTINLIGDEASQLFALIAVSEAKEKLGETDASLALLDAAAALSETVPQPGSRSGVLNEIAGRYVELGRAEKARAVSLENLNVILAIRDESSQAVSLANLSSVYDQADFEITDSEKSILKGMTRNG